MDRTSPGPGWSLHLHSALTHPSGLTRLPTRNVSNTLLEKKRKKRSKEERVFYYYYFKGKKGSGEFAFFLITMTSAVLSNTPAVSLSDESISQETIATTTTPATAGDKPDAVSANTATLPSLLPSISPPTPSQRQFPTTLGTRNIKTPTLQFADDLPSPRTKKQYNQPQSPSTPAFSGFLKSPTSFSSHRNSILSVDSVPRQTILKALASGRPTLDPACFAASLDNVMASPSPFPKSASYSPLPDEDGNFTEYHDAMESIPSAPLTARILPALQSPCFYHQRFDNAVNVERVLEEITGDEYTSHSRLVQTALGVREVARQLQRRNCKMNVKNVMIVTKARDNQLVTLTRELASWIMKTPRYGSRLGLNVYVDKKLKESKRFNASGLIEEEPKFAEMLNYWTPELCWSSPETFDLVLTLGGDGTVLFTSWLFQRVVPPILSFSLGSLGFLTNFQFDFYKEHLDKVFNEGMRVNMRMRFTCTVYRDEGHGQTTEGDQFEVLNELVIDRGPSPYVSNLELYGDDDLLTVVQADGCIFSTPTGMFLISCCIDGTLQALTALQARLRTLSRLVAHSSIQTSLPSFSRQSVHIPSPSARCSSTTRCSCAFRCPKPPVQPPGAHSTVKVALN